MNNLKSLRISRGMTRPDLAKATGIKTRTILAWEQGERSLDLAAYRSIMALANVLKVTPEELFDVKEET